MHFIYTLLSITSLFMITGPSLCSSQFIHANPQDALFTGTPVDYTLVPEKHALWDSMLKKYVDDNGKVDYAAWAEDRKDLQRYIEWLSDNPPSEDESRGTRLAYWINAYNAFTVDLVLDHYPVESIRDIHGGNPWDVKLANIGGKKYSLNEIEHEIIRKRFDEPRIHFALNCAALSCPPLLNRAYRGANLDTTLEEVTRNFIRDEKFNQITSRNLNVSSLFDWYAGDFGNVRQYLQKYTDTQIRGNADISYKSYDWQLNDRQSK